MKALDITVDSSCKDSGILIGLFGAMLKEARSRNFASLRVTMESAGSEEMRMFFEKQKLNRIISNLYFPPPESAISFIEFDIVNPQSK